MKRQVLIAFGLALLVGGGFGAACTVAQPPLECSFQASSYWARYKLVEGTGTCSTYEGDLVRFQRYLPPGESKPTFAFLNRRLALITRATYGGKLRFDETDPTYQKESPRGTFAGLYPTDDGFCSAESIVPADQSLPAVTYENRLADGGVETVTQPATHVREEWSNFKLLNNAQFTSTLWTADVTVVRDGCTAKYAVDALWPPVACETDADCNPLPDLDAGHVTGSGLQVAYAPKCVLFSNPAGYEAKALGNVPGVCMPTVGLDELSKLK